MVGYRANPCLAGAGMVWAFAWLTGLNRACCDYSLPGIWPCPWQFYLIFIVPLVDIYKKSPAL